jgi:hypothetical protein
VVEAQHDELDRSDGHASLLRSLGTGRMLGRSGARRIIRSA